MKPGFCYLVDRSEAQRVASRVISSLGSIGVVLSNPATNRITQLADDGHGEETSESALLQAVAAREWTSFSLWFSADISLLCGLRRLNDGLVRHSYLLDGLDADERERVAKWSVDYFKIGARNDSAFLVAVDPVGATESFDWDAAAVQLTQVPEPMPAVLGGPSSWLGDVAVPQGHRREHVGTLDILIKSSVSLTVP